MSPRRTGLLLLSLFVISRLHAAETQKLPILYPFVSGQKCGYIDGNGTWVIPPRFERCTELFESDHVRVWEGNRWGWIDRNGQWIVPPRFNEPCLGKVDSSFQVVYSGKKAGILNHSGKLILPVGYQEIVIFQDRAWVRSGEKLGLFALDGHWLLKPSIAWPAKRAMPIPTGKSASWFERGTKWGLLSLGGRILFEPQFHEHEMGRKEVEEWDHPEGLDFQDGRAWVKTGGESWLITEEGKVLCKQKIRDVRPWTDELYTFTSEDGHQCLISHDGVVVLAARFIEIGKPSEGRAVVADQYVSKTPDGKVTEAKTFYGYIDLQGRIVVAPGTYSTSALTPFSDGLAPVWNNPGPIRRPVLNQRGAGYIDANGALAIPEQFWESCPFSDGLGAVSQLIPGRTTGAYTDFLWGYVDKTGALAVPPSTI